MQINQVAYDDIDDLWPFIEPGIEDIIASHEKDELYDRTYVPMETYDHLKAGHSMLLICLDDYEVMQGFFLIKIQPIKCRKVLIPHTICLRGVLRFMDLGSSVIKDIAKKYNCDDILIKTTKKGWFDMFKKYGYKREETMYEDGIELYPVVFNMRAMT